MRYTDTPPFAPTLMESTRAIGYSIEAAIADIIDNSIAANASTINIDFFPIGKAYISILDDGHGMSEDELTNAMKYGSQDPLKTRNEIDLGRYGLGMKTASFSQCRVLTVITKSKGVVSAAQWNLDHVKAVGSWSLIILNEDDIAQYPNVDKLLSQPQGTIVIWQDLDKFAVGEHNIAEAFKKKMKVIREHLSLVFHRYINGEPGLKKLDIRMNEDSIPAHDPFLSKKSTQLMDEETITIRGEQVVVTPYILPHVSKLTKAELKSLGGKDGLRRQQGFYVYRNKRLLVWGTWFRLMRQGDLSKLARVQVDIPNSLDDLWTLDIKKSTATPPEEIRQNLSIIIDKISEGSKRTWTYRGRKETTDNVIHMWNRMVTRDGSVFYEINPDYPMIQDLFSEYPDLRKRMELVFQQISYSIPLNSLYLDLTNDEKIDNDNEKDNKQIINMVKAILSVKSQNQDVDEILDSLKMAEPFCAYTEEIDKAKARGEFDD